MAKQHFYCFSREAIKAPLILGKKSRKAEGQGRVVAAHVGKGRGPEEGHARSGHAGGWRRGR